MNYLNTIKTTINAEGQRPVFTRRSGADPADNTMFTRRGTSPLGLPEAIRGSRIRQTTLRG